MHDHDHDHIEEYNKQRRWADKFVGRQLYMLAQLFNLKGDNELRISTTDEDIGDGVDVYAGPYRIGLRVRRHGPPRTDITIRLVRNKYGQHELDKVRKGQIDYMLYTIATETASDDNTIDTIQGWKLIDLAPLAYAPDRWPAVKTTLIDLPDGGKFLAVDLESLARQYGPVVRAEGDGRTPPSPLPTVTRRV